MQAVRQGRAVGATIGFFLKFKPYATLEEIRRREKVFQPVFGPVLVVDGDTVREVLERDQEFTVEPYGVEMRKVMSPAHNGGFGTFVLSTDDNAVYEPDKQLLAAVCNRGDADADHGHDARGLHAARRRRGGGRTASGVGDDRCGAGARALRAVTLGHRYLGVPVAAHAGYVRAHRRRCCRTTARRSTDSPRRRSRKRDGVIPDEPQMYGWIKAAFQHFFNNVQKDPAVKVSRPARLPAAARVPPARDRHPSASGCWTARPWTRRC